MPPTRFDEALAGLRSPNPKDTHGQAPTEDRGAAPIVGAPEPSPVSLAASDGMLLRTVDVRAVRREERTDRTTGKSRSVVCVDFIASDESVDSHETILIADWAEDGRLKRYLSNPVVLWMHGREGIARPAIGNAENVRVENKELRLTVVCDDTSEFDREVAEKLAKGVLRGGSVGWCAGAAELRIVDGCEVVVFSKNELREFSIVNVGSNANALASQRALIAATREMVRAAGGPVDMRTVIEHVRALNPSPAATAEPLTTTPGQPASKDPMKSIVLDKTDLNVRGDDATCAPTCPECNKAFDVTIRSLPVPASKLTEITTLTDKVSAVETRAVSAEKKAHDLESKVTETTNEINAAKERVAAFEKSNETLKGLVVAERVNAAERALTEMSGKQVVPAEIPWELSNARDYLSDLTPDPEKPGATLGDKRWGARLALLQARKDSGLLGAPITTTTPIPAEDPKVRAATDAGAPAIAVGTSGGHGAADLIAKRALAAN